MSIKCPICGSETITTKVERNDPPCHYDDFVCSCRICKMFHIVGAADGYYGRDYFKTVKEFTDYVIDEINKATGKRC